VVGSSIFFDLQGVALHSSPYDERLLGEWNFSRETTEATKIFAEVVGSWSATGRQLVGSWPA